MPPQPPQAFSIRGLRLYFPALEPWVAWSASLPAVCPVYLCMNVGPRGATRRSACPVLCRSESCPLGLSVCDCGAAGSASVQTACPVCPTLRQSGSCHGHASPLHFLGVGLPCHSIFCQFWLCEEAQCVYLRRHLGSSPLYFFFKCMV